MNYKNSIGFEQAKDYKRFNLTNVLIDVNIAGDVSIEFYEDIELLPKAIFYYEDETGIEHPEIIPHEHTHLRSIHATATLPIHRMQNIIDRLQAKLNEYTEYIKQQQGE